MKHLKKGRKFGRETGQRRALIKILLGELIMRGKIKTTEAKAKELKGVVEKIIGKAKLSAGSQKDKKLAALRYVRGLLPRNVSVKKIEEIGKQYAKKTSGFTRVIKTGQRKSDGAEMAVIELIKEKVTEDKA